MFHGRFAFGSIQTFEPSPHGRSQISTGESIKVIVERNYLFFNALPLLTATRYAGVLAPAVRRAP